MTSFSCQYTQGVVRKSASTPMAELNFMLTLSLGTFSPPLKRILPTILNPAFCLPKADAGGPYSGTTRWAWRPNDRTAAGRRRPGLQARRCGGGNDR
eukprot:4448745-Pleurochrysis_carterae.AAC.3